MFVTRSDPTFSSKKTITFYDWWYYYLIELTRWDVANFGIFVAFGDT